MTAQQAPSPALPQQQPARRIRRLWVVLAIVLAVSLAAGGYFAFGRSGPLDDDPAGAHACKTLADWLKGDLKDPSTGKPIVYALAAATAADAAAASKTSGIRAAAGADVMTGADGDLLRSYGGPASLRFADLETLHLACTTADVDMPAYNPPSD